MAKTRDFISAEDISPEELRRLLDLAARLKRDGGRRTALAGRTAALLFEKPSLRTRVSFEVAVRHLGGDALFLGPDEVSLGRRERVSEGAVVLSRYVDLIVARTFSQAKLEELCRYASVPVVNALSDEEHPCQALADLLTLQQRGRAGDGGAIAYVGDGNNVARSLAVLSLALGFNLRVASPEGFSLPREVVERSRAGASGTRARLDILSDPREAVKGADAVYTDVWTSMGQEEEAERRRQAFSGYQVTRELLDLAQPRALFMHPLPAHVGEEVAEGVLEDPRSVVFEQAENRLHTAKALLLHLLQVSAGA